MTLAHFQPTEHLRELLHQNPGEWHYIGSTEKTDRAQRVQHLRNRLGAAEFQVRQRRDGDSLKIYACSRSREGVRP